MVALKDFIHRLKGRTTMYSIINSSFYFNGHNLRFHPQTQTLHSIINSTILKVLLSSSHVNSTRLKLHQRQKRKNFGTLHLNYKIKFNEYRTLRANQLFFVSKSVVSCQTLGSGFLDRIPRQWAAEGTLLWDLTARSKVQGLVSFMVMEYK